VNQSLDAARSRWLVICVFVLSSTINYLDRQTLAVVWPAIRDEFHLSYSDYGWIIAAFYVPYALAAPFAGLLIDRSGLNRVISGAVGVWSCASIATGFTTGIGALASARAVLGMSEASGVPSVGKALHLYLLPADRALGNAMSQAALSVGMIVAPPLATWITLRSNWRMAFVVPGLLGLIWIPIWAVVARRSPSKAEGAHLDALPDVLRDRRLWIFAAANAVGMFGYSLWTQFTTTYLVDVHHLSLAEQAWLAWIPPVFGALGGLAGGWLSARLIHRGTAAIAARFRICLGAAMVSLATPVILLAPGPVWACAGISLSIAAVAAFSVNMYTLPLDAFGAARAAFAVSMLVASYGVVQIFWPFLGRVINQYAYPPVILLAAVTPLIACGILWSTRAVR
jgi:ACS family hexuronate transporter-like MFS transporter